MDREELHHLYHDLGGEDLGYAITAPSYCTAQGTPYLKAPGVILVAQPVTHVTRSGALERFLIDLDPSFGEYVHDEVLPVAARAGGAVLPSGSALSKLAGQLCYLSFGPKRTKNADASKYFDNILSSGHGSVLEHPSFSFLLYGVSRSFTHELVRHRAGCAFSQVSQRYVDKPRFVERREYQDDIVMHQMFVTSIDRSMAEYEARARILMDLQERSPAAGEGTSTLSGETKTDRRKKVNQSAREVLPNETEAPILFTANVRALRHIIHMRASKHADTQIREVFYRIFLIMALCEPILFQDCEVEKLPDGTHGVVVGHPKV